MTLDKMDVEVMLKSMRVYVAYLVRFCNTAVIPYDHVAVAKGLRTVWKPLLRQQVKLDLSAARKYAGDWSEKPRPSTEPAGPAQGDGGGLFLERQFQSPSGQPGADEAQPILHPINFSVANRYGFDHYGLTALSTPTCLYETRTWRVFPAPRIQALLTHLVQQANRVSDGLRKHRS
jgi:hypothetical protein